MTEHEPPRRRLDWAGAVIHGLLGGLANNNTVGAIGTALRDLAVQDLAQRTADQLKHQPHLSTGSDTEPTAETDDGRHLTTDRSST